MYIIWYVLHVIVSFHTAISHSDKARLYTFKASICKCVCWWLVYLSACEISNKSIKKALILGMSQANLKDLDRADQAFFVTDRFRLFSAWSLFYVSCNGAVVQ